MFIPPRTGSAISWDGDFNTHTEDEVFSSVIDLVLNCACFVYIGAWLPFESFNSPELGITLGRLFLLFLAILFLRRIPAILILYRWVPEIQTWQEALFSGHFGKSLALSVSRLIAIAYMSCLRSCEFCATTLIFSAHMWSRRWVSAPFSSLP